MEVEMLVGNMVQGPCHQKMLWFMQVQGETGQRKSTVDCEVKTSSSFGNRQRDNTQGK